MLIEIIMLLCLYGVIGYFRFLSEQKNLDRKHEYLHLSNVYFYLGLIGSILFSVGGILIWFLDSTLLAIVFLTLAILFTFILSGYYGYRIYYDNEKIVYRRYFEKYKAIYYKDITRVNYQYDIEIMTKEKQLTIPCYIANASELLEVMLKYIPQKAMKKLNPKKKVRKFSDSVYRPKEFIFAFVLMYLLVISFDALLIICVEEYSWEVWAMLGLSVIGYILPIISFISAKRAHASKFWRSVANICYKSGYLKNED